MSDSFHHHVIPLIHNGATVQALCINTIYDVLFIIKSNITGPL